MAFKELGSCDMGQKTLVEFYRIQSSAEEVGSQRGRERDENTIHDILCDYELRRRPPLLHCWKELLRSVEFKDVLLDYAIEAIYALTSGCLSFCMDGKRLVLLPCFFIFYELRLVY